METRLVCSAFLTLRGGMLAARLAVLNQAGGFKIKGRPGEGGGRKMPGGTGMFIKKEGREQNICMT